jgi:hypothetical protein
VKTNFFASEKDPSILKKYASDWHIEKSDFRPMLDQLRGPFRYPKIVKTKSSAERLIDLANAKGFLGEFISTDPILRNDIRTFVNRIREYTLSTGTTRPLNCLVVAKPGSGKSFFAEQVAIETGCGIVKVNCSQIISKKDLLDSIARLQNVSVDKIPLLFIDEVDSEIQYYPLLLAPLWDSRVVIEGELRRWRERSVSILVASQSDNVKEYLETLRDEEKSGKKGRDLLSRLNGPTLTLSERGTIEESLTSRVYLAVQMLVRYHPTTRVAERGLLDLLYCAPEFNPRTVEHFITALPKPVDGIVSLKGVRNEQLEEFAKNLGCPIADGLQILRNTHMHELFRNLGYEEHCSVKLAQLKTQHIRLTESTGREIL